MRKKDVVLMATVTSFEGQQHPSKSELRQFAELFAPLFQASSDEAKRQAVAALSQCAHVPPAVSLFIGSQPIGIAAIFLTRSLAIDDETLVTVARTQGTAHAKAITRRENLSPMVIDALVGLRQASAERGAMADAPSGVERIFASAPAPVFASPAPVVTHSVPAAGHAPVTQAAPEEVQATSMPEDLRFEREEALRRDLKQLARHFFPPASDRLGLRALTEVQDALLVRFARNREAGHFSTTLADSLSTSRWLAERIMLDISGQQLATTLISLGMDTADAAFVLVRFYPHLGALQGVRSRADLILAALERSDCDARVDAWRRADSYTFQTAQHEPHFAQNREADPRQRTVHQLRPVHAPRSAARTVGRAR